MNITIPKGITRIAPMILDDNCRSWHEKEADQAVAEYPLYEHAHIERLVIPESVDIPHAERFSPFASYKQRPFVCNQATHCQRIEIVHIENHSPHLLVEDGVLYSATIDLMTMMFSDIGKTMIKVPEFTISE